jgi:hypothetical protein
VSITTIEDLRRRSHTTPLDPNPYDPCWHWDGAKSTGGVPAIWTFDHDRGEKRTMPGPMAVWNIAKGCGTGEKLAYRTCCATACVNPQHIALAVDRAEIGRHIAAMGWRKGRNYETRRANLVAAHAAAGIVPTPAAIVLAIRAAPATATNRSIAAEHDIGESLVSKIRLGKTRRSVVALEAA